MQQKFWQRIRLFRWLLALAMVATVTAIFIGPKLRSAERLLPAVVAEPTIEDGNLTLNNFEYRDVKEGNARWTVRATTARYFEDRQETVLSEVNALFFLKDGGQVNLLGDEGVLNNDNNNIRIRGNVRVLHEDGYKLLTDSLAYERDKELIHTDDPVYIEGQDFNLKGLGMRLDLKKRKLSILQNIETIVQGVESFSGKRQTIS
ncbi:MAG: LPS export ABC transporter periplasmic protein LptC [Syntrophobacterales bacterium]|jgi:lipopolysaccharide export system protein LptC